MNFVYYLYFRNRRKLFINFKFRHNGSNKCYLSARHILFRKEFDVSESICNGFASKLMIYESTFAFNPVLAIIAMVVSILTLASFMKVFHSLFLGPKQPEYAEVKEAPKPMIAGMIILTVFVVVLGIFPDLFVNAVISPAADALLNSGTYLSAVLGGGL